MLMRGILKVRLVGWRRVEAWMGMAIGVGWVGRRES